MLGALRTGVWAKGPSELAKQGSGTGSEGEGNRPAQGKEGSGKKRGACAAACGRWTLNAGTLPACLINRC